MFGRRLYLPDIRSRNQQLRQYAERSAINAPMQGTVQVHDELVLEVRADAVAEVEAGLRQRMAAAAQLRVPLKVDVGHGPHWDAAH